MPVYKDEKCGTWFSKFRYKDWTGKTKDKMKRGFKTRREAVEWETNFKARQAGDLEMNLKSFVDIYVEERFPRLKKSTRARKENIINTKIIPYFGKRPICEISSADVIKWQNHLINEVDPRSGKNFTKSYLKAIHAELNAIFNYACRYYKLPINPAAVAGNIGDESEINVDFWTLDEYKKFAEEIMDVPAAYYAFEVLYWMGIREGELLALTPKDIDFKRKTMTICKTYQVIKGEHIITSPKTNKSNRTIVMPDFLCEELMDYMEMLPNLKDDDRLFKVLSKTILFRYLKTGAEKAGVKRIRVHDLRHSHVSLLIDMGYSAVAIADRLGHESIHVTYKYAHMFPNVQNDMANQLNSLKDGK
ncbi:site-specific integrase [Pseudobutyrivibrio sp.]|uniref:site-specific integrase n=1 Tax=Pseudobutyrivibrio sp. TaxID=2014367 RepID=UPI003864B35D